MRRHCRWHARTNGHASSRSLALAHRAAAAKQVKYSAVASTQRAHFIPFAVETTGGITQEASQLIDQLSFASKDHLTLPSHHPFAHSIFASIAIAIQRATPWPSKRATREQS